MDLKNSGFLLSMPEGGLNGLLLNPVELPRSEFPPNPFELFII